MPPGAIVLSQTRQTQPQRGSDGPPTGFLDNIAAGTRVAMDQWSDTQALRRVQGYADLGDALVERGVAREALQREKSMLARAYGSSNAAFDYSPDLVWQAVERARAEDGKAFADIPKTRHEFEKWVLSRKGERQRDQGVSARGRGVGAFIGNLAGQSAADMADSDLGPLQFIVGAGGKTAAQAFIRAGTLEAVIEGAKQPERIRNRQQLGEKTSAGEIALDIGGSFVFAGALAGGGKFLGDNWDAIKSAPAAVQERAWGAILDRTPGLRDKVGAKVDWDSLDPHLADIAEATIDRTRMTDAERGAILALRRESEIDAGNPFVPDGAGTKAHYDILGETLQGIINDSPAYVPKTRPSPAARLRTGSSIATGVTGDAIATVKARIGVVESGGSATARNPRSSAMGLYQFTNGTWLSYYKARFGSQGLSDAQIIAKKGDTNLQNTLMDDLLADNSKALQDAGFAADPGNLYLAHFAGHGGATKLLRADPNAPVASVLGQKVVDANPFLRGMRAADVIAWAQRKMGGKAPPVAARTPDAGRTEADVIGALDRELADTQDALARLDSELAAGTRGIDDALDDIAPDAVPVVDATPLPRIDAPTAPRAPIADTALPETDGAQVISMTPEARAIMPELRRIVDGERAVSLNNPAALSTRLGVDERNLQIALQQMAIDGLLIQKRNGSFTRLPQRKDGPEDIFQFIASRGGLADNEGHDLGSIFEVEREVRWKRKPDKDGNGGEPLAKPYRTTRPALIPGYGPLVRRGSGLSVDDMGEQLWEAGYFGPYPYTPRPTEREIIAVLQDAWGSGSKVFSVEDAARVADMAEDAARASTYADPRNPFASDFQSEEHFDWEWRQFDNAADEAFGVTLDQDAFVLAWGEYRAAGDGDIRGAVLRAIQREIDDVQARQIAEKGAENAADIIDEWEAAFQQGGRSGDEDGAGPIFDAGDPGPSGPPRGPVEWEETGPVDPERWQAWDEPDGDAARITADSMEHDLRVQAEAMARYQQEFDSPRNGEEAADLLGPEKVDPERPDWIAGWELGRNGGDSPPIDTALHDGWTVGNNTFKRQGALDDPTPTITTRADGQDDFAAPTGAQVRTALERQTEGGIRPTGPQRAPGSDGGLFDTRDTTGDVFEQVSFRLDEEGDVVNPADLLAEFEADADFFKNVRDCL